MGNRKSQVDKFNARVAKMNKDTKVVTESSARVAMEENKPGHYGDSSKESVEKLMAEGSIKEAAVVFSYEGMSAFANMFGNSMESAVVRVLDNHMDKITQSMEQRIDSIVEAKMLEMMQGMTEGMRKFQAEQHMPKVTAEEILSVITSTPEVQVPKTVTIPTEVEFTPAVDLTNLDGLLTALRAKEDTKEKDTEESAEVPTATGADPTEGKYGYSRLIDPGYEGLEAQPELLRLTTSKADYEFVKPYMMAILKKYKGQNIKSTDAVRTLGNDFNIKMLNITAIWKKLMADDPSIESVGFGTYRYEEKTFKPTI